VIILRKGRPAVRERLPTEADELAAYRSFLAQAGRYTICSSRLIHHRDHTRDPAGMGTDEAFEFTLGENRLVVQGIRTDGTQGKQFLWQNVG
jgi:hypothetical protein